MPSKTSEQDLYQLAHAGFPDKLDSYLQKNGTKLNVNEFSKDGATALIQCVQGARIDPAAPGVNHVECCRLLLRQGADPNLADKLGRTALHWAVFYKKAEFVDVLLQSKGDITVEDKKGQDVVQFSIRMNASGCLKLICETLTDSNSKILSKPSASVGTPLIYATKMGHKESCEILLQHGANIDIKSQKYFDKTPLHIATELDNFEIVEMLIKYDADTQTADSNGNTILHLACANTNPRCTQAILDGCKKGVQRLVEGANKEGLTPLMLASQMGHESQVKLLLEHDAPVSVQDEAGKTALHHATEKNQRSCAELLLAADSGLPWTQDSEGRSPLHLAVIEGKKDLVELLIENSGSNCKDNQGHTPVHWAVVCGFHDLIDTLVDHGGDPSLADDHGAGPLHYAAQMCGDPSVSEIGILCLKTLIKRGAKVNALDVGHKTPLLWAASAGSSEACRLLQEAGADMTLSDLDGLTALHCAVTCSHSACVDTLLQECGCAADVPDKNGCTPLFYAASMDQADNVQSLIDKGASPNYTDNNGKSPMHCAAGSASMDALRLLQEHGGSLDQETSAGDTPFFEALQKGDMDTIKFMLKKGCKPDVKDDRGRTPLHVAAENSNLDLCRFLVELKVDKDAIYHHENGLKLTPLDCAWESGAVPCIQYLESVDAHRSRDLDPAQVQDQVQKVTSKSTNPRTSGSRSKSPSGPHSSAKPKASKAGNLAPKDGDDAASVKSDGSRSAKSPYVAAQPNFYDHAKARNEEKEREAEEKKNLRSTSVDKKLADWESYIKDHVHFLDDLLCVDHERLESIQAHAEQEKGLLVDKLEEIRSEMEKRMEKKSSEAEKQREERKKQQAEEKKALDERWKQIEKQYMQIDSKASKQLTAHRQATQSLESRGAAMEKRRIRKEKAEAALASSRRPRSRASTADENERTQKHQDWLKRKNKEYQEKKNAVKLKGPAVVSGVTLDKHIKRSVSPSGHRSPVFSKVDHSHSRRTPSPPPHPDHSQQHHHSQGHQRSNGHAGKKAPQGRYLPPSSSAAKQSRSTTSYRDRASHSPHPPSGNSALYHHQRSERRTERRMSDERRLSSGESVRSGSGGSCSSGPNSHSPTSHQLAQLRRSHGNSLNRKMWPKSWELREERRMQGEEEQQQEEIYDLKRNYTPRWDGMLRPRHLLQFSPPAGTMNTRRRQETPSEA